VEVRVVLPNHFTRMDCGVLFKCDRVTFSMMKPPSGALNGGDVAGDFTTDDTNSGSFDKRPDGMLDPDLIQACHEFSGCTELTCTKLKMGKTL